MNKTGYVLKAKKGTQFEGNYLGQKESFVDKAILAVIYNDEMHAKSGLDAVEFHSPYEEFKKEDIEIVEISVTEIDETPDFSWMWHGARGLMDYTTLGIDNGVAKACNRAATNGMRLTLRKLEDMGLIQMSDIDRAINEKDSKLWEEAFEIEE